MGKFNVNNHMRGAAAAPNPEIEHADSNLREAGISVQNAVCELGRAYFEANKDNAEAEYYEQVAHIKNCMDHEKLCHQYRLSLEGQVQCEKCGTIVTSNSLFCNQCGSSIQAWYFSGLGIGNSVNKNTANAPVCRACGKPLVAGAAFCEICGAKV